MGDVIVHLVVLASFSEAAATAPKPYVRPVLRDEVAGMMMLDQVHHLVWKCCMACRSLPIMYPSSRVRESVSVCKKSAYTITRCSSPSPQKPTTVPNVCCMLQPVSEVMCHFVS